MGTVRTAVVWDVLREVLAERAGSTGRERLDIVDAGGGTGGFAVPFAELGHAVTVVDPSPDALAALERRAAESAVTVRALQGDAVELPGLVGTATADLIICHSVLEYVDDPAAALDAIVEVIRPGGAVSVLAANPIAAVIHRALTGHFDEALSVLGDPAGRWGARDPMPRRFTLEALRDLLAGAGLKFGAVHGVRVVSDLVPSGLVDGDARARDALIALEKAAAVHPALRDIATQLHILAHR